MSAALVTLEAITLPSVTGGGERVAPSAKPEGLDTTLPSVNELINVCLPAANASHASVPPGARRDAMRANERQKCFQTFWKNREGGDNPKYYKGPQYW